MADCAALCDEACVAISLFQQRECWVYAGLDGAAIPVGGSIFCVKTPPPPPPTSTPPPVLAPPLTISKWLAPTTTKGPDVVVSSAHASTIPPPQLSTSTLVGTLNGTLWGFPVLALIAAAFGLVVGVGLLVAGCCLLQGSRRARRGGAANIYDKDDEDELSSNEVLTRGAKRQAPLQGGRSERGGTRGVGPGRAGAAPMQRVLVEACGEVSTVRVATSACYSLPQLRKVVAAACVHLTRGASEKDMLLEYIDEEAGLAITVSGPPLSVSFSSIGVISHQQNSGARVITPVGTAKLASR